MNISLQGKKEAILTTNDFEQSELEKPREALEAVGAETEIISPEQKNFWAWNKDRRGNAVEVDVPLIAADPSGYDPLRLPGGVMNPDTLRTMPGAVELTRASVDARKPVASLCHGSQLLIEARVVHGRKMTSHPSIKTDLVNADAVLVDEEVVVDRGLITSCEPDDIARFNDRMIEEIAGIRNGQRTSLKN